MKRLFVRAGIALVGMTTWLLPNQAKADVLCSTTVGGVTITWSCPDGTQCFYFVIEYETHYAIYTSCI